MTEHGFAYDQRLLDECVRTPLFAYLVHSDDERLPQDEQEQGLGLEETDRDVLDVPCLQLFEHHQRHYQRREAAAATTSEKAYEAEILYERRWRQSVGNQPILEYRVGRRLRAFVQSVGFVHRHNRALQADKGTEVEKALHRVALNRFSDLRVEDVFTEVPEGRRLLPDGRDVDDGADTWLVEKLQRDGVVEPLDDEDAILEVAANLAIGRGSLNRMNPKKYKKIYHQSKTLVLPPESDAPVRQFQTPEVEEDLNGAILSIRPERYSNPYDDDDDGNHHDDYDSATATPPTDRDGGSGSDDNNGTSVSDSNYPVVIDAPPPKLEDRFARHLNWATTDNPDGVAIVHDAFDQGACGACWAFAATGSLEASAARRAAYGAFKAFEKRHPVPVPNRLSSLFVPRARSTNGTAAAATVHPNATAPLSGDDILEQRQLAAIAYAQQVELDSFQRLNLSIQELVDCDIAGDQGCTGGNPLLSFYFIHRYGLTSWDKYPYAGYQERCREHLVAQPIATVKSWGIVSPNHETHMELVLRHIGPIAAGINGASPSFLAYSGGIYDNPACKQGANHALLITGYGEEEVDGTTVRFWYARNSWGRGFGENGYVRIKRGDGAKGSMGVCGIARSPSVALGGVLFPARGEAPGDDATLASIMATRGPLERVCYRLGLQYNTACLATTSWVDDHKAFSLGAMGILIGAVATYVLTYDCRRRRRRRMQRQRQRLSSASLNAAAEASPLLQAKDANANGGKSEYGSGGGSNCSAV